METIVSIDQTIIEVLFGVLGLTFCLALFRFLRRMRGERRSLWLGISFMTAVVSLSLILLAVSFFLSSDVLRVLLMAVLFGVIGLYLLFPLALVVTFMATGVRLVSSEGARLSNFLSLGAGILAIAFVLLWGLLSDAVHMTHLPVLSYLHAVLAFLVFFTSTLFAAYVVTSIFNRVPRKGRHYSHIVVLGAGLLDGSRVSPLLAGRISKGIAMWRENPGSVLVMSGGQGSDEKLPEGRAMREWALQNGVPADAVVAEERSLNTRQNLEYSWELMGGPQRAGNVLVVSDNYHVYRALLLAKHLGFDCDGRGSHVKLYFAINAMVREFVAFLVIWKRTYVKAVAVAAVVLLVLEVALRALGG